MTVCRCLYMAVGKWMILIYIYNYNKFQIKLILWSCNTVFHYLQYATTFGYVEIAFFKWWVRSVLRDVLEGVLKDAEPESVP